MIRWGGPVAAVVLTAACFVLLRARPDALVVYCAHDAVYAEPVLRRFERALLGELGYGLELTLDANGASIRAEARYRWVPDHGLVPSTVADGSVSGDSIQALATDALRSPTQQREARQLLQQGLQPLLGDRPLQTPGMLRQLRRLSPPG